MSATISFVMGKTTVELLVGDGRCIEHAARDKYQRMAARIMAADGQDDPGEEAQLELLLDFFKSADFALLRSSDERLSGIKNARCLLKRNGEGIPYVSIIES